MNVVFTISLTEISLCLNGGLTNLHIISNTLPTAVFIELGNIRNTDNQKRLILSDNRQALANWIYPGLADALL